MDHGMHGMPPDRIVRCMILQLATTCRYLRDTDTVSDVCLDRLCATEMLHTPTHVVQTHVSLAMHRGADGDGALVHAVRGGHHDTLRGLLAWGVNPNVQVPEMDMSVLHYAIRVTPSSAIVLARWPGTDIDDDIVCAAVTFLDYDELDEFLDVVHAREICLDAGIRCALELGLETRLSMLLDHGAHPTVTEFEMAARDGALAALDRLLDAAPQDPGMIYDLVRWAAEEGHTAVAHALFQDHVVME